MNHWSQESPYAGVKTDPDEIMILDDRVTQGVNKTLTPEAWEQVRVGRRCVMCEEPQVKEAFPVQCSLCGFPMRDEQMKYFERLFAGEEWVGTTINFTEELDRLDDELERDNFAANPSKGIVLQRGVRA